MLKFYNDLKSRGLFGLILSIIILVVVIPYLIIMFVWDLITLEWFSAIGRVVVLIVILFTFTIPKVQVSATVNGKDYRAKK